MTIVQRSPNLGLTLRMQRIPKTPTTPTVGDGGSGGGGDTVVGWFSPIFDGWWQWYWEERPDGRWDVHDSDYVITSIWEGDPQFMERPTPTALFRCVEISARADLSDSMTTHHVGVLQGSSMTDVRWEATWDTPNTADPTASAGIGNRFRTWGNVVTVEQLNTGGSGGPDGTDWTETLTATAFSGDAAVGTLVLHCFHPAY